MLVCLGLTQNVIFPVVSSKVREGHRVLDVDSELLRVLQDGGVAGELLVILHRTPGRDLAVIFSRHGVLQTLPCGEESTLKQHSDKSNVNQIPPTSNSTL